MKTIDVQIPPQFYFLYFTLMIENIHIVKFLSLITTGAIKFGNKLTKEQCKLLLQKLAKCNLPFQCAHGRPTLTPLLNLHDDYIKVRFFKFAYKINLSDRRGQNNHFQQSIIHS